MEQHTERQTEKDIQSRQRNKRTTREKPDNKHADETYTVRCEVVTSIQWYNPRFEQIADRFMHIQTGSRREEERE